MELTSEIKFPIDARELSFGQDFWRLVELYYSDLMPGRYGNDESLKNDLTGSDVQSMLETSWQNTYQFIWKPKKIQCEGMWSMTNGRRHSSMFLHGKPEKFDIGCLKNLYRGVADTQAVDLSFIHVLGKQEFEATKSWHNQMFSPFNAGINPVGIKKHLPNLAWGMFFGPPYIDLIGVDVLKSAPVAIIEEWGGGIYIQVTNNIQDVCGDYDRFDQLRLAIKSHLGNEYFFNPSSTVQAYKAPQFAIGSVAAPKTVDD